MVSAPTPCRRLSLSDDVTGRTALCLSLVSPCLPHPYLLRCRRSELRRDQISTRTPQRVTKAAGRREPASSPSAWPRPRPPSGWRIFAPVACRVWKREETPQATTIPEVPRDFPGSPVVPQASSGKGWEMRDGREEQRADTAGMEQTRHSMQPAGCLSPKPAWPAPQALEAQRQEHNIRIDGLGAEATVEQAVISAVVWLSFSRGCEAAGICIETD